MKKLLLALLLFAGPALAQTTQTLVSGIITDPNGVPYYPATVTACLTPVTTNPIVNGQPVNPNQGANYCIAQAQTSPSGFFSRHLWPNAGITPAATQWTFSVAATGSGPPAGKGPQTFQVNATVSGTTQDLSATLSAAAPVLLNSGSSSGGNTVGAVFSVLNYGWVDDDSTDNCGTPINSLITAVNAYAGPGIPQVLIPEGPGGKAYKLATTNCHVEFDKPVAIHLWGTIDCAQTGANCFQFGASGLGAAAYTQKSLLDGGGTFVGGANLTNAGIEMEPYNVNTIIHGITFTNFGAGNATHGNCSNYAILFDTLVFEGTVSENHWQESDAVDGRCAFGNPGGATTGQNTIFFAHNTLGGAGNGTCGSQGIVDGGSYGQITENNIYGFGISIRVLGIGHGISNNQLDSAGCTASGVNAAIQFGGTCSSTAVGTMTITNNVAQFGAGHLTHLLNKAGDSTATLKGATLTGNQSPKVLSLSDGILVPSSVNCTGDAVSFTNCYIYGNASMQLLSNSCGSTFSGWQIGDNLASCTNVAQTANLGNTLLFTPFVTQGTLVTCNVVLTTAATTSSTLPSCVVSWTDFRTSQAQSVTLTPTWTAGGSGCSGSTTNTVGNSCQSVGFIFPGAASNVNYSTTGYVSSGATPMQYAVYVNGVLVHQP